MEVFAEFFSFQDPNVRYVTLGCILMAISSSIVGCFTFLKKKALVGDAVSHAVLPGICIAFLFSGTKDPLFMVIGATITGWLALVAIDFISANSRLSKDTAIALVLSVTFGIGILMLTFIQKSGNAAQTGLDQFLFGKAASLIGRDLLVFSGLSILLIAGILLLYKELRLISFDPDYGKSIGYPVERLELTLTTLIVLAIVAGIQAVGVVLMAAMLITPAAAARYWTNRLGSLLFLAALFGAFSGLSGAFISYLAPAMPTGPWIVMVISMIALISFIFAPRKGIIYRQWQLFQVRRKIMNENLLKTFYHMGEADKQVMKPRSSEELLEFRPTAGDKLLRALTRLTRQGFLKRTEHKYALTEAGRAKGQRLVRLHRLWEVYLIRYMSIAEDHVHEDAETIEHLITPELEKKLEKLLEYPTEDPHNSIIPYENTRS